MTAKKEISEELMELSGVVAGISRLSPYTAPEAAYFEGFSALMLTRIKGASGKMEEEEYVLPNVLQGVGKGPSLDVPAGYFDGFAASMLEKLRAGASESLPNIDHQDPRQELAALSPLLNRIGKENPFQVPHNYFNNLSIAIPELPPLLAGLQNKEAYQVPPSYFEEFAGSVLDRIRTAEPAADLVSPPTEQPAPARVIPMRPKTGWLRYAGMSIAASFILVIGWLTLHTSAPDKPVKTNPETNSDITKTLSNVSDQEIQSYLDNQHPALAEELANSTAAIEISANDLTSMLDEVSDAELKEYMEDHGNVKDLPTN